MLTCVVVEVRENRVDMRSFLSVLQAIDLVDEACSNVRVQLDSKPENIDSLERQRVRLQVEEQALKKEKDP